MTRRFHGQAILCGCFEIDTFATLTRKDRGLGVSQQADIGWITGHSYLTYGPTCQAARGISLWSQHAPGLLLGMIANAVRDNVAECEFEGQLLRSSNIQLEMAYDTTSLEVDAVSVVLVPHLDKLYYHMQQLVALRGDDPHRWVNPAFYGRWVPHQFVSAIDSIAGAVKSFSDFVRRFCTTHHQEYNDGYQLVYPE